MKHIRYIVSILCITMAGALQAQSVPQGMRYQAVASRPDGSMLQGLDLHVRVDIYSPTTTERVWYSESHRVHANAAGLLDFIIGEGTPESGTFTSIPWESEALWIRISAREENSSRFQIISSGQLYSVPYAQYAKTAGVLVGPLWTEDSSSARGGGNDPSQTAAFWALNGNANAHNPKTGGPPVLGTTDRKDLTFITRSVPRMIISWNGDISLLSPMSLDGDLNVGGNTTLQGSLTIEQMSSAYLTGTLTVDKNTIIGGDLVVDESAPAQLTGAMEVSGPVVIKGATVLEQGLMVAGWYATQMSGVLQVDGPVSLRDGMTVQQVHPAHLTGQLDVDGGLDVDGQTVLHRELQVTGMYPTHLRGSLTVDQATSLFHNLLVANMAPTHLTGSLKVDGAMEFSGLTIDGDFEVISGNETRFTGTLEVDELVRLHKGLDVRGGGMLGPDMDALAFFDNTEGGNGDGIAIRVGQADITKQNNFMTFYRGANTVAGRIEGYSIGDIDEIPLPTTDEIWSAVCVGIADYNPVTIMWTQMATAFNLFAYGWNNTTIPEFDIPDIPPFAIPDIPALAIPDVPAFVIPDVPGFTIPDIPGVVIPDVPSLTVGPYLCVTINECLCPCDWDITSWNCCCVDEEVCAIPEFTLFPGITIPDFPGIAIPDFPGIPIPDFPGIVIPDFPGVTIPDFPGIEIPPVPEINLQSVIGTCPTLPTFSDLLIEEGLCPDVDIFDLQDGYIRRLMNWALENRLSSLVSADPLKLAASALTWGLTTAVLHDGVVYGSKGADYAEYLPKRYPTEKFMQGDIVGVYQGRISKETKGADQVLAITSQPIVLGNTPSPDELSSYEKVSFMGQVPVYVRGKVEVGDYLIPSGLGDGVAIAIKGHELKADLLTQVMGTAWSSSDGQHITLINASMGIRPTEIWEVIRQQAAEQQHMQLELDQQYEESAALQMDITRLKKAAGLR